MSDRPPLEPRAGYDAIRRYAPGEERAYRIDLSDNTNRWGMAPEAAEALRALDPVSLTRYPSLYGGQLSALLADYANVPEAMVVTGTGSDGVLEPAIRAFARPGDRLAHADPTFVMIGAFARMNEVEPVPVPLRDDYDADAEALLATGARIIYLCSPNNPTGRAFAPETIARVAREATGLVIVDEAYAEFAGADALAIARASDRVLVTRTLSKAFGLAGLRVGYGIGAPALVRAVEKARGPYAVSTPAEVAGAAALGPGRAWMRTHADEAIHVRGRLFDALTAMGLRPAPSDANFVFVPVRHPTRVARALLERDIVVRTFTGLPLVTPALRASGGKALRINVAPWPVLEEVLEVLRTAVANAPDPEVSR